MGVVDVPSTFMLEYPLTLKDLEISHELYGAVRGPERWRGGVYGTNGEASVSGPETVDRLSSRQPTPIARICRKERGGAARAWYVLASSVVYSSGTGFNVIPQILTYPIHSNPTRFGLLFARGARTQFDSVMHVIEFGIPVIGAYHTCH